MSMHSQSNKHEIVCRDAMWDSVVSLSRECGCSVDFIINDAIQRYLTDRLYTDLVEQIRGASQNQQSPVPQSGFYSQVAPVAEPLNYGVSTPMNSDYQDTTAQNLQQAAIFTQPAPSSVYPAQPPVPNAAYPSPMPSDQNYQLGIPASNIPAPSIPSVPPPRITAFGMPAAVPSRDFGSVAPQGGVSGFQVPAQNAAVPQPIPPRVQPSPIPSNISRNLPPVPPTAGVSKPPAQNSSMLAQAAKEMSSPESFVPLNSPPRSIPAARPSVPPPPRPSVPPQRPAQQPFTENVLRPGNAQPHLTLIFDNRRYIIDKDKFIIGRSSQLADLAIRDANISRKHCAIVLKNDNYYIKDLDSTNGIEYNGDRIDSKRIAEGDVFYVCEYAFMFTYK